MLPMRRLRPRHTAKVLGLIGTFLLLASLPLSRASAQVAVNGVLRPAPVLLLPYYRLDFTDPSGTTTLLSVRNSGDAELSVRFAFYAATSPPGDFDLALVEAVAAHQTLTLNLRTIEGLGDDGLEEGYVVIRPVDGDGNPIADAPLLSGDHIRLDPAGNHASSAALVPLFPGTLSASLCSRWSSRILERRGLAAETRLQFLIDSLPAGEAASDGAAEGVAPVVARGTFYGEDGESLAEIELVSDRYAFEVAAAELALPDDFGSVEWTFAEGIFGFVGGTTRASGRYEVDLPATCLDAISPLSPQVLEVLVAIAVSLVPDAVLLPNQLLGVLDYLVGYDPETRTFKGSFQIADLLVEVELYLNDENANPIVDLDSEEISSVRMRASFTADDFELVVDLEQAPLAGRPGLFTNGSGSYVSQSGTRLGLTLENLTVPEDGLYPDTGGVTLFSSDLDLEFRLAFDGTRIAEGTYTFRGTPASFTVDLETGEVVP